MHRRRCESNSSIEHGAVLYLSPILCLSIPLLCTAYFIFIFTPLLARGWERFNFNFNFSFGFGFGSCLGSSWAGLLGHGNTAIAIAIAAQLQYSELIPTTATGTVCLRDRPAEPQRNTTCMHLNQRTRQQSPTRNQIHWQCQHTHKDQALSKGDLPLCLPSSHCMRKISHLQRNTRSEHLQKMRDIYPLLEICTWQIVSLCWTDSQDSMPSSLVCDSHSLHRLITYREQSSFVSWACSLTSLTVKLPDSETNLLSLAKNWIL